MKEFCKWLGVNEKIAKIVVWMFILMCMLIIFNIALESMGFPYYKLTAENISKVNTHKLLEYITGWTLSLLNFYSIILLVFPFKDFKKLFKYALLYLFLNAVINVIFDYAILQIFIIGYILAFCYLFSKKNWKYIFYGLISYVIGVFIQYICYLYKVRFLDFTELSYLNKLLTSFDFLIIIGLIIFIKEIIIKKKGVK